MQGGAGASTLHCSVLCWSQVWISG
jgi:hypothetical protein